MAAQTIKFSDIPKEILQQAGKQIEDYLTGLILDNTFIGSGTFITWENKFGILTAEHVTNNPDSSRLSFKFNPSSNQALQLVVTSIPHRLAFEVRYLQNATLGHRVSDEFGPDASVIILPEGDQLAAIRSKKSFWPLDVRPKEKMDEALNERNFVVVAGCPEERRSEIDTSSGKVQSICGIAVVTMQSNYLIKDNYDYVETSLGLGRLTGPDAVLSYEGVSGGSLWRIKLFQGKDGSEDNIITRPYLAGVVFWQGDEVDGVRVLRSHGPKTIYESLLPKLLGI